MTTIPMSVLQRGEETFAAAMRAAVDRLDPSSRAIAAYHLGWTDVRGRPVEGGGGKAVRPALALLSAEAAGGPAEAGLPGAVAVELVHNFSLLHDDVMDGDVERRHRPSVWVAFGSGPAILAGDAMLALTTEVLLDAQTPTTTAAARLLADATRELIRGQFEDLSFETRADVTLSECLAMAAGKTGALLSASAAIGAVLAGGEARTISALAGFGRHLGLAFQLVDDLLGIWGDPRVTGKPVLSDLRARKKTLPVTYALASGGAAARELAGWVTGDEQGGTVRGADEEAQLQRVAALVEAAGGRAWAATEAERQMRLAEAALDGVALPARPHEELVGLGRSLVARET